MRQDTGKSAVRECGIQQLAPLLARPWYVVRLADTFRRHCWPENANRVSIGATTNR